MSDPAQTSTISVSTETGSLTTHTGSVLVPSTRRRWTRRVSRILTSFGLIVILLVAWQVWTMLNRNPYFPQPVAIVSNTIKLLFAPPNPNVGLPDILTFLARMLSGFVIGSAVGILVGMGIGLKRALGDLTNPIIEFLRSIPATATLPIFIILFGGEDGMRVGFIAFGLTWYVIINTASGVSTIDQVVLDMTRAFRISRMKTMFRVVLPAASPKIFAGLRIALTTSMLLTVVSEFYLVNRGIGFQLLQSLNQFAFANMWSWMLILAILGYLANTLLELVEHRVLRWDRESHAR